MGGLDQRRARHALGPLTFHPSHHVSNMSRFFASMVPPTVDNWTLALVIRVRVRVTHGLPRTPRACAAPRPSHTALRATTELSVYALLRADYQQQHAARSELSGDPAPAPCSATVPREPPGTHDLRLRRCPQGNTYNTPGGTNSNGGSSYHYSNSNGSYYYANDNGSTYYQPPPSSSAPPVYTPAPPSK